MFEIKKDAVSYSLAEIKRMKDEGLVAKETLEALRNKADGYLKKPVVAVTKRLLKPASGDPHDYMSMGTYWWPNPDTPSGLPYIRRDGHGNPEGSDPNNFWEMLAQVKWCTLAAFYFDEDKYSDRAVDALYTWYINPETYMHPHAKYAQAIPGICDGRSIGLIDFRDSFEIMNSVRLLDAMGKIPSEYVTALEKWYTDFTDWMLTHEYGVDEDNQHNNHGTWYDVQILAAAVFTGRPALAKKIITTAYPRRFLSQIEKTGAQPHELARTSGMGYSLMNQYGYATLAVIAQRAGDARFFARDEAAGDNLIKLAVDYLYPYIKKPEDFPFEQIHTIKDYSQAAFTYLALAERMPETHCKERFSDLMKPEMLFLTMPVK